MLRAARDEFATMLRASRLARALGLVLVALWACEGSGGSDPAASSGEQPFEGTSFGLRVQSSAGKGAVLQAAVRIAPPVPEARWAPLLAVRLSRAFASCERAAPGRPTSLSFQVRGAVPHQVRAESDDALARCMAEHWPRDPFEGVAGGPSYRVEVQLLPAAPPER